jgi:hypothetical protein
MTRVTPVDSPALRQDIARRYPLLTRAGFAAAWVVGSLAAFQGIRLGFTEGNLGSDAHAYWLTRDGLPYDLAPGQLNAFLYSPAFAQVISPLTALPYPLFLAIWIAIETAALWWLVSPLEVKWAIPLGMLCVPELVNGNVYLLLAAAAVVGMTRPTAWIFVALTKLLPAVGALWHGLRGNMGGLTRAVCLGALVVGVSYVIAPDDWARWFEFVIANRGGSREGSVVFVIRSVVAVCLLVWGARTNRPWVIAPMLVLTSPALAPTTATLLIALPRLLGLPPVVLLGDRRDADVLP